MNGGWRLSPNLLDGIANATVGHLDVKHCADGRSDVDHIGRGVGAAFFHVPAHEQEGYVGVVGIPCAVRRANIVGADSAVHMAALQHYHDISAAKAMVAVGDALA